MAASWLLLTILLVGASALFTSIDTALLCGSELPEDDQDGRPPATSRDRVMAALLIGNTFTNVLATVLTVAMLAALGCPMAGLVTAPVMTLGLAVLGELLPREIGRRHPGAWLALTRRPLELTVALLAPAAQLLNRGTQMILLLVGLDPHELHPKLTSGDLRFLVKTGAITGLDIPGAMATHQKRLLHSAHAFADTTVREVLVPLPDVRSLRSTARVKDALELARSTLLTRFPVWGARADEILGVINIYDILYSDFDPEESIKRFMRPALYVPNTVPIDKLIFQMQSRKTPLAVVVDEFGGADGIVSVNDVVEEVIGAFEAKGPGEDRPIQQQAEGVFMVDGHIDLDELNRELALDLPKKNYETLAGFLMTEMEKVPREGDKFVYGDLVFTVSKARRHTIQKVQLRNKR